MSGRESRKIFLSPNVNIVEIDGSLLLVREGEALRAVKPSPDTSGLHQALLRLRKGSTIEGVSIIVGREEASVLLRDLATKGLLLFDQDAEQVDEIWARQSGYLAQHFLYPTAAQERLSSKQVAMIGVGGVGGIAFQHLIAAGVSNFQLLDYDFVASHNLNRQYIYDAHSVGRSKIDAAAEYAVSRSQAVRVKGWKTLVTSIEDLQVLNETVPDLLVLAADEPVEIGEIVNSYCVPRRIPFIVAGVGLERGFWGPLIVAGRTSCLSCFDSQFNRLLSKEEMAIRDAVRSTIEFSFGPVNSIIASLLARDAILFLAGTDSFLSMGARITFNSQTLQSTIFTGTPCNCWPV